jgi:hypothetical protein
LGEATVVEIKRDGIHSEYPSIVVTVNSPAGQSSMSAAALSINMALRSLRRPGPLYAVGFLGGSDGEE